MALFTCAFYYITQATVDREADTTVASGANVQSRAAALADILLQSGDGWYAGDPCTDSSGETVIDTDQFDPDGVSEGSDEAPTGRFGLGEESCLRSGTDPRAKNNLSYEKLYNLYNAETEADDDNGHVDYEEARRSLGLLEGENFHIRSWPIMGTVNDVIERGIKDRTIRPLYLGDYVEDSSQSQDPPDYSHTVTNGVDRITVRFTITNTGTEAAIYATMFEIPLDKNSVDFTLHTPLLAPDESHTIEFTVRKSADWEWDDEDERWIEYDLQDRDGTLAEGVIDLSSTTMTQLTTATNVFVEADNMYWALDGDPSTTVRLNYMAFTGEGEKKKWSDWTLLTTDPLGLPMVALALTNNVYDGITSQTALLEGAYHGAVKTDLLTTTWNIDYLNVVETDEDVHEHTTVTESDYEASEAAMSESALVEALIEAFDDGVFHADYATAEVPYMAGGDIYPDLKSVMNNDLVDALTYDDGTPSYEEYNMLIVGSDVDHNAMTSNVAKEAIEDWVYGGGTLIVFGSDEQNVNWLNPSFQSSLETASGGLQTPDEGHPVLNVPNTLDYAAYEYETMWDYNADAAESFTSVVSTLGGGDVMAVSNAGAFGSGRIILTSWRPYVLAETQEEFCELPLSSGEDCEALFLIHNVMTLSYQYLFLDYGPEIPTEAVVGSHLRVVTVYHPELKELVPLQLQLFVFD